MKKFLLTFIFAIFSSTVFAQSDCQSAINICGNSNISYTPSDHGAINEPLQGCVSTEHFTVWYSFTVATSGTLTFVIDPNLFSDDYDWTLFGPNVTCANKGNPIRCNYSGADGPTGLNMTSTILSGTAGDPPFCRYLDVIAGETYYLMIDNFSRSTNGFSLNWGGTASLASPFNDPQIQPNPFIPPGIPAANPNDPRIVQLCDVTTEFNFSSLSAGIINNNPNFYIKYFRTTNDALADVNPIVAPILINTTDTYFYVVRYADPLNPDNPANRCSNIGSFKFQDISITTNDATLTECNNNGAGVALYNLTAANVIAPDPTYTYNYYPTLADANAGTNEITTPTAYTSATGDVFVKVTTQLGCWDIAKITLRFHPLFTVNDATLRSCYLEANPSTALFNLTTANITAGGGVLTKKYYPSITDAINSTNEILTPDNYISPNGMIFIKASNNQGCYMIAKVTLIVLPPVKSTVLQDKTICIEDKTTLDAGPGFAAYEWSTGATTQSITDVSVGTYWVKLKTGECFTTQNVTVYPAGSPVISNIDINGKTITVNVNGGNPPYKYSIDNITWQDSNVFENLNRGEVTVYVKDSYDCTPIQVTVTIPNIINVITPNGDGINDVIDYSALGMKDNLIFNIYDRYGVKIHQADKTNGYKWNGTIAGKQISTGTYWYSVTWNEKDKTSIKYSGWIVVKNRE